MNLWRLGNFICFPGYTIWAWLTLFTGNFRGPPAYLLFTGIIVPLIFLGIYLPIFRRDGLDAIREIWERS